jgi:imidazole glycerol phosphate synthase glutamine amidotransferase subunit
MIDLVDYGGGNTGSVRRCLGRLGLAHRVLDNPGALAASGNPILFPGVGSFGAVMEGLRQRELDGPLAEALRAGRPYFGICVGLQALFDESEEAPGVGGLGVLPGRVRRFRSGKVPQIGWNRVEPAEGSGLDQGYAYFVNSYVAEPADPRVTSYRSDYFGPFCAGVRAEGITAYQFHPEKSGRFGHDLVRRWADAV